jgi:hypothetical protein
MGIPAASQPARILLTLSDALPPHDADNENVNSICPSPFFRDAL